MNAPNTHETLDDDQPLDPAVEKVRRRMVRFFAINIGILMIALMAVLAAIVYKSTRGTNAQDHAVNGAVPGGDGALSSAPVMLGQGERVISQSFSGDRVSLLVEDAGGRHSLLVLDLVSGQIVARVPIIVPQ